MAIIAAVLLATHQRRLQEKKEREADRATALMCMNFGVAVRDTLNALAQACQFENQALVQRQRHVFYETLTWPDLIDAARLPAPSLPLYLELRALANEAKGTVVNMHVAPGAMRSSRSVLQRHRDSIDKVLAELSPALNVPAAPPFETNPFTIDPSSEPGE